MDCKEHRPQQGVEIGRMPVVETGRTTVVETGRTRPVAGLMESLAERRDSLVLRIYFMNGG